LQGQQCPTLGGGQSERGKCTREQRLPADPAKRGASAGRELGVTQAQAKNLVVLRRIVLPIREVVNSLMRGDLNVISEPMASYCQDVYDHVLRSPSGPNRCVTWSPPSWRPTSPSRVTA
jgi:Mg2+ and Co2+ transporter CorA